VPAVEQLLSGGHGGRRQVLVYAGDGEDTDEADDTSDPDGTGATPFAGVRGQLQGGVVLGYGTEDGGVMPLRPADPDRPPPSPAEAAEAGGLVPDVRTGGPAVSHASPTNLEEIADQIDASFVRADGHQDMGAVARAVQKQAYAGLEPVRASRQVSWLWGLLLLVLVAPDLRHGWRRWLQARREVAR
jgi:Ca-activated chloride channel family protein